MTTEPGPPRGVLRGAAAEGAFRHERRPPAACLAGFVEHVWTVSWDLSGAPVCREVLSHPSVHVVLERGASVVAGVPRGRFVRWLAGAGEVFGIKFRPGAFRPLVRSAVSQLTDRTLPIGEVLGRRGEALADAVLAERSLDARIAAATEHLRAMLPALDPASEQATAIVAQARDDREIRKVEDLARRSGQGRRALQRLFSEHVGVSPKWVIQRYRLHEAIARMDGGSTDAASLALELGYTDQAHFIRDFKAAVGRTPGAYGASGSPPATAWAGASRAAAARRRAR